MKGSSQAGEIALSLRAMTSNLTRELSYLLFRVEIRNRILAELEKLSYKRYLAQDKFSISFFCAPELAGRFLQEQVFAGSYFTSEPDLGPVTKTIVKLDIDQSKILRYQGKTCLVSVRVNDITEIELLLGKHFNLHIIKPITFRTGGVRHFHVVAIKPTNPMLIFSYDCNIHKFSIRSDIVRRINVQQCLYLRSDNTEGEFHCMHYFHTLMGKVFTDEDDNKKYRAHPLNIFFRSQRTNEGDESSRSFHSQIKFSCFNCGELEFCYATVEYLTTKRTLFVISE